MRTALVIPARWGSTRLPGKPLALIAGRTMLARVVALAQAAAQGDRDIQVLVATDDERIAAHCATLEVVCAMTPVDCPTGTDRARLAVMQLVAPPDFIVNMQGDAPLTPPDFVRALIDSYRAAPCDVVTPVTQLNWTALDQLRATKTTTPHSGTTAVFDPLTGRAHWFSKMILPSIRNEAEQRGKGALSPVWRHIGLYGYSRAMLEEFGSLTEGYYEKLEGLEQLRVLEHDYLMRCVPVDYRGRANMSGVDSPEDVHRAEAMIAEHGELLP